MNRFAFKASVSFLLLMLSLPFAKAQFIPAPTPIADPADTRFKGVKEDWTTPSLTTSSLRPADPLAGYIDDEPDYTMELIQLQWRFGDPLDVYVMKPKGVKNPPVILYLYGYPAGTDRFKSEDFQKEATRGGFAAVGFVSALTGHRYHDRPMKEWFLSELQECLATSAHDVQMVINYLSSRGDLDMNRLGMFTQGSGADIAIFASAVDPRIGVLDALDPWGDWPTWMAKSPFVPEDERSAYVKSVFLQKISIFEPTNWISRVQARKFRLQDATFDSITPSESKEKLRAAVPAGTTMTIYKTPEDFNAVVRGKTDLDWIKGQLRSLPDGNVPQTQKLQQARK